MRDYEINPFQELYVTDSAAPTLFVQLFSDEPVKSAHQLFRPGNVVLKGTQGSGKSTLLTLFRPEIRLAYYQTGARFPVPRELERFVGGGINLRKSGALDIGQRPLDPAARDTDEAIFPFLFADFFNYFIVRDLLESIKVIADSPDAFDNLVDPSKLDVFAQRLSEQDCWFGALDACCTFHALVDVLDKHITAYRQFHLFNAEHLLVGEGQTRTAIGEPISRCAECMRTTRLIPDGTPVFIRVDELDRLASSDIMRPQLGVAYRRIINKAIGMRDARVSYRVGTRIYGWESDLQIFGTADILEDLRDFQVVNLDENMRRAENRRDWVFPNFAADTLRRRLQQSPYAVDGEADVLRKCFGTASAPGDAASEYVADPHGKAARFLKHGEMPAAWRHFLDDLFELDPFEAILAAAWVRQKGLPSSVNRLAADPPRGGAPWDKEYWRKERVRQALMQIAARAPHRLKWSGKDQILALSGANIFVFLSICHEIWDAMHRARRAAKVTRDEQGGGSVIDRNAQSVGIYAASEVWYRKIIEQPGGSDRQRFVDVLGSKFRDWLLDDNAMSHPGRNGFSLDLAELKERPRVAEFLKDAVAYGDLYSVAHTTKERDRKPRQKWYLSPILSPFFQIPETHTKEPYYARVGEVEAWLLEADVHLEDVNAGHGVTTPHAPRARKKSRESAPRHIPDLFGGTEGDS